MTKETPFDLSFGMLQAALEGRKSQVRVPIYPQPPRPEDFPGSQFGLSPSVANGIKVYSVNDYDRLPKHLTRWDLNGSVGVAHDAGFPRHYYAPFALGDLLWVREEWRIASCDIENEQVAISYRAEGEDLERSLDVPDRLWLHNHARAFDGGSPWLGPQDMPRWASRLTLEVMGLSVELLQDLTEADAIAEGIRAARGGDTWVGYESPGTLTAAWSRPQEAYADLWDRSSVLLKWANNPWVVVAEVEPHARNIGDLMRQRGELT